mmetsp:Transcript_26124/g.71649  ORF Transcript_26124/g.71649 Transcript_26124/m.71649 type:complete len:216 (+) Transcript_26124:215-862(+)
MPIVYEFRSILRHHAMSRNAMPCRVMPRYATLRHVTPCHSVPTPHGSRDPFRTVMGHGVGEDVVVRTKVVLVDKVVQLGRWRWRRRLIVRVPVNGDHQLSGLGRDVDGGEGKVDAAQLLLGLVAKDKGLGHRPPMRVLRVAIVQNDPRGRNADGITSGNLALLRSSGLDGTKGLGDFFRTNALHVWKGNPIRIFEVLEQRFAEKLRFAPVGKVLV